MRTSRPRRGPRERTSSDPNRRIFRVLPAARPSAARWKMVSTIRRASAPVTPPWQLRTVAARSALFNVETRSFLLLQGGRTWGIVRQWEVGGARGGGAGVRAGGAQARERRPLVGTARRRRAAGKDPKFGGGSPLGRDPGVQRHPDGRVVHAFRWAPRSGADQRSAFPALCAALPAGVRAETGTTPRAGDARLSLGSAQRCRPEVYTLRTSFSGPSGVRGTEGPYFTNLLADPPGATNRRHVFRTPTPDCASTGLGRDGTHGRRAAPSSSQYRPQRTSRRLTSPRGASLGRTTAP